MSSRQRKLVGDSQANIISDESMITLESVDEGVSLKRQIGVVGGIALIAGTMIGSGIFISPKGVLEDTGSVGLCLIIWALCGVLSMFGALAYAELGAMITKSGGEWAYLSESFGHLGRFGDIPAYLFSWVSVVLLKPSSLAIISIAFSQYIMSPFFDACGPPKEVEVLLTIATIMFISAINIYSVGAANKVQIIFFWLKLTALVAIICGGFYRMGLGDTKILGTEFEGTIEEPFRYAKAFYKGLWAYDGWNNLNYVTGELKNPKRNVPLSICISIPLVTVVYLLTNIAYFTVLSTTGLLTSDTVAVDWAGLAFPTLPSLSIIITICVAFSTFGAANGTLLSCSRLIYSASKGGHLVSMLSMVDVKRNSPSTSIALTAIIACIMTMSAEITELIDFFSFTAWIFYGLTMIALLILRWKEPDRERPFRCPIAIPVIVLIASLYLIVAPIIDSPDVMYLLVLGFILLGLVIYFPFVAFKKHIPGIDYFTMFVQHLMRVVPTDEEPAE